MVLEITDDEGGEVDGWKQIPDGQCGSQSLQGFVQPDLKGILITLRLDTELSQLMTKGDHVLQT